MVTSARRRRAGSEEEAEGLAEEGLAFRFVRRAKLDSTRVMKMTGDRAASVKGYISTQIANLDAAIGKPGIPIGRVTLIVGETSVGKTTLTYHLMGEVQRMGGWALYIDGEAAALDAQRAKTCGADPEQIAVDEPDFLEQAFEDIEAVLDALLAEKDASNSFGLIILDSVAGLPPQAEFEGDLSDHTVGLHARAMKKVARRLMKKVAEAQVALVIINQWTDRIGASPFEKKRTMPAERACTYMASLHLELTRGQALKQGDSGEEWGVITHVKVEKNKIARPHRRADMVVDFENGLDIYEGLLVAGEKAGVISKNGGWYTIAGTDTKFQASKWEATLQKNPHLPVQILSALEIGSYHPDARLMHLFDDESVSITEESPDAVEALA